MGNIQPARFALGGNWRDAGRGDASTFDMALLPSCNGADTPP